MSLAKGGGTNVRLQRANLFLLFYLDPTFYQDIFETLWDVDMKGQRDRGLIESLFVSRFCGFCSRSSRGDIL